jgi:acyl-[acyl carrier protein]--UDP-N-acetylglucosamine O-acyltransferase
MRRAGYDGAARRRVREAYRVLFQADTLEEGIGMVRALGAEHEDLSSILDFYGESRRGYSRPASRKWLETQPAM